MVNELKSISINTKIKNTIRLLKWFAIPVIALSIVFIFASYPVVWNKIMLRSMLALGGIFLIWEINGRVSNYIHNWDYLKSSSTKRLITQIIVSLFISWGIVFIASQICSIQFGFYKSFKECLLDTKELYLVATLFSFLIVAIYENIFTVKDLFASMLEKESYKKSLIEARYQYLSNQLNPHYLFNNLNTLANLIKEDPGKAYIFVSQFSASYQYVLSNSEKSWVTMKDELDFASLFLELAKVRFEDSLIVKININQNFSNWLICPLTLQMLVENAIKHNIVAPEKKLKIEIYIEGEYIVVKNNLQYKKNQVSSTQTGLNNIKSRYMHLVQNEIIVAELDDNFIVKVPLVNPGYECCNN
jgi:two-component system, LytTR family, sensor kinase